MTTTAKPLPPHGSQARYKGATNRPPCRCARCIRGWTQAGQRRQLLRLAGKPASLTRDEVAEVVAHIKACTNSGMSQCLIARRAGVSQSTVSRLLSNPQAGCLRIQGERILAVRPGDFDNVSDRPALGTIRRIRGLYYAGHGPQSITVHAPLTLTLITEIAGSVYESVAPTTEAAIKRACTALTSVEGTSYRARARALREGWAPLNAWDDIDDPQAVPDWTGYCGTDRGWWLHRLEKIPVCPPCETAHAAWKAERAQLTKEQRWAEIGKARSQARAREADLAHDARELLRYGAGVEQAAERLGVTKQHLQQAMLRHPEPVKEAA
ncbi:hypothetical protein [Streptomyces spiralis]